MDIEMRIRAIVREEMAAVQAKTTPLRAEEEYLTTKQVAEMTGLSVSFFEVGRSLGSPGHPPYLKVGSRVLYSRTDIAEWLEKRRRGQK
jgi:excisionase family DNA binding protein